MSNVVLTAVLVLWVTVAAVATTEQQPFLVIPQGTNPHAPGPAASSFKRDLAAITSEHRYTALSSPRFPGHQVRVKKSNFCDPTVKWALVVSSC